jgi:hypothetical protein
MKKKMDKISVRMIILAFCGLAMIIGGIISKFYLSDPSIPRVIATSGFVLSLLSVTMLLQKNATAEKLPNNVRLFILAFCGLAIMVGGIIAKFNLSDPSSARALASAGFGISFVAAVMILQKNAPNVEKYQMDERAVLINQKAGYIASSVTFMLLALAEIILLYTDNKLAIILNGVILTIHSFTNLIVICLLNRKM